MIRVLIKAASSIPQAGLEALFRASPAFEVVGAGGRHGAEDFAFGDSQLGSTQLGDLQPDVVVAEIETQDEEAVRELLDWAAAGGAVVLLVDGPAGEWARELLRAGIKAVLPNRIAEAEILAAAEAAAAGLVIMHPSDLDALLPARAAAAGGVPAALAEPLTPREIEVLRLLAEGIGNKEISARMAISEHTVKFHIASIMGKMGATSRTEVVTLGIRHGLILI